MERCPYCFKPLPENGECDCHYTESENSRIVEALEPGTVLGACYQIGAVLGKGGFGITYKGFDLNLEKEVAIKEFYPSGMVARASIISQFGEISGPNASRVIPLNSKDADVYNKSLDMFFKEARVLAKLSKLSNVVHIYQIFRENNTAYFVMDYVRGKSLSRVMRERGAGGGFSEQELIPLLDPVLAALEKVHDQGILHRDIAPDNIVIDEDGNPVLLDFGAAKVEKTAADGTEVEASTMSSVVVEKKGFTPIEQIGGHATVRSDIYALGATYYYLLTGKIPPESYMRAAKDNTVPLTEYGVSQPVSDAVMKAFAFREQERWQNVADFRSALKAALQPAEPPTPPTPPEVPPIPPTPPTPPRNRLLFLLIPLLLLIGAGAAFLLLRNNRPAPAPVQTDTRPVLSGPEIAASETAAADVLMTQTAEALDALQRQTDQAAATQLALIREEAAWTAAAAEEMTQTADALSVLEGFERETAQAAVETAAAAEHMTQTADALGTFEAQQTQTEQAAQTAAAEQMTQTADALGTLEAQARQTAQAAAETAAAAEYMIQTADAMAALEARQRQTEQAAQTAAAEEYMTQTADALAVLEAQQRQTEQAVQTAAAEQMTQTADALAALEAQQRQTEQAVQTAAAAEHMTQTADALAALEAQQRQTEQAAAETAAAAEHMTQTADAQLRQTEQSLTETALAPTVTPTLTPSPLPSLTPSPTPAPAEAEPVQGTAPEVPAVYPAGHVWSPLTDPEILPGYIVRLGSYDGSTVSWIVLDAMTDGKLLLLSEKVLDTAAYNPVNSMYTEWESSGLRKQLNGEFLDAVFPASSPYRGILSPLRLENGGSYDAAGRAGYVTSSTEDTIFLLSVPEMLRYRDILAEAGDSADGYWLRSQGVDRTRGVYTSLSSDGRLSFIDNSEVAKVRGIRPAAVISASGLKALYQEGCSLLRAGDYAGAADRLSGLEHWKDILDALYAEHRGESIDSPVMRFLLEYEDENTCAEIRTIALFTDTLQNAQVGDTVRFGIGYDTSVKSGSKFKGPAPEWILLEKDDEKALFVMKDVMLLQRSRTTGERNWSKSSLRTYLNGTYYNSGFDAVTRDAILTAHLYNGADVPETDDRIFILSAEEAFTYLSDADLTALLNGKPENGAVSWWLRFYDEVPVRYTYAPLINSDGRISFASSNKTNIAGGRPALWLDLHPFDSEPDPVPVMGNRSMALADRLAETEGEWFLPTPTPEPAADLPFGAPEVISITQESGGDLTVRWTAVGGVSEYALYYSTKESFKPAFQLGKTQETSLTVSVPGGAGAERFFRVSAAPKDGSGSLFSETVSFTLGSDPYTLTYREAPTSVPPTPTPSPTAFIPTQTPSPTPGAASVQASETVEVLVQSETAEPERVQLAAPVITRVGQLDTEGHLEIYWTEVEGASKYSVYYSTRQNFLPMIRLTETTDSFVTVTVPDGPGDTVYFKVRASQTAGAAGPYSETAAFTLGAEPYGSDSAEPGAVPVILSASVDETRRLTILWTEIEGADSYTVYYSTAADPDSWQVFGNSVSGELTRKIADRFIGETLLFTVRARSGTDQGEQAEPYRIRITAGETGEAVTASEDLVTKVSYGTTEVTAVEDVLLWGSPVFSYNSSGAPNSIGILPKGKYAVRTESGNSRWVHIRTNYGQTAWVFDTFLNYQRSVGQVPFDSLRVGDIFEYGYYEQDGNLNNGKEAVEWQVLAEENGRLLVISRSALEAKPYHESAVNVTWETSTLREWLNGEFLTGTFSEAEQERIASVTHGSASNPDSGLSGGNDVEDRIFIPDLAEAEQYLSDRDRTGVPTAFARTNGVYRRNTNGLASWWLRTPGAAGNTAAYIDDWGSFQKYGKYVNEKNVAVRPAFWLLTAETVSPREEASGEGAEEAPEAGAGALLSVRAEKIVTHAVVKTDFLLRNSASNNADVMLAVRSGQTLSYSGENRNGWLKVTTAAGVTGWIAESAVQFVEEKSDIPVTEVSAGDRVWFGQYEQDETPGADPIEWQVLTVQDGRALLLSRYALDSQAYNTELDYITWENSSLRVWLNGTFLNEAFRTEEQMLIPEVTVSADKNPKYSTDPGNSTSDRLFLLSISEAERYFASDEARQAQASEYAKKQGAYTSYSGNTWWWLRSPGLNQFNVADVSNNGSVLHNGTGVDHSSGAVRPALWLDLSGTLYAPIESAAVEIPENSIAPEPAAVEAEEIAGAELAADEGLPAVSPDLAAGDTLFLGHYEQDETPGADPIEWQVLDVQDGRALLLSVYALDGKPFFDDWSTSRNSRSWETSELREWLNGSFFDAAFAAAEKDIICEVRNNNTANPVYGTSAGANTMDKVFLLSIEEAEKYLPEGDTGICFPTDQASSKTEVSGSGSVWWWLRTFGSSDAAAAGVNINGIIDNAGRLFVGNKNAVRPAVWIDLSKMPFAAAVPEASEIPESSPVPETVADNDAAAVPESANASENAAGFGPYFTAERLGSTSVKTDFLLRAAPSNKADVMLAVRAGQSLSYFGETQNGWLKVTTEAGVSGWIADYAVQEGKSDIPASEVTAGDRIRFGRYEQDETPGADPIEWQVLTVQDGRALLLSRYALDSRPYNTERTDVTWESSSLRAWLNGTFLNEAFRLEEQMLIPEVTVSADKNPSYSTDPGNSTLDKIFLLSISDAERYFASDEARQAQASEYAKKQGAYTSYSSYSGNTWWWLRSPGYDQYNAANVYDGGSVGLIGGDVSTSSGAVRPALWLDLTGTLHPAAGPAAAEIPENSIAPEPVAVEAEEISAVDETLPAVRSDLTAGDTLFLGSYEQDAEPGADPIEWQVLDVQNGRALLLSRYALDSRQYNIYQTDVTWENSSIRAWLNGTFLNRAFSTEEQMLIPEVTVSADKNPGYNTDPGNSTSDRIFLLSISEAERYLASDEERQAQASAYAKSQGAYTSSTTEENTWWWLRSPGLGQRVAALVRHDGSVYGLGLFVHDSSGAVRPALWLDLSDALHPDVTDKAVLTDPVFEPMTEEDLPEDITAGGEGAIEVETVEEIPENDSGAELLYTVEKVVGPKVVQRYFMLRAAPSHNADTVLAVRKGHIVSYSGETQNGWLKVTTEAGVSGWIDESAVQEENSDVPASEVAPGDMIRFGRYEQDAVPGADPIEWQVLDVQDGRALLLSRYALDCKPYNTEYTDVTWESSSLRTWLNGTFLNEAFSTEEQMLIPEVTVSADNNPSYRSDPGNSTSDKIFLLSISDLNRYFVSDMSRYVLPTEFTKAQGAVTSGSGYCKWWGRSTGSNRYLAAIVHTDGSIDYSGHRVVNSSVAVRPALWIDLSGTLYNASLPETTNADEEVIEVEADKQIPENVTGSEPFFTVERGEAMTVKTDFLLRSAPSNTSDVMLAVRKGQPLSYSGETQNGWLKVTTEAGVTGWIAESAVQGGRSDIPASEVAPGDMIRFGRYEQDGTPGADPIEWQVLDVQNGRALLLSRYALDSRPYNTERTDVTWESSSLRAWLNGTFLNEAFRLEEQMLIPEVTVSADKNPSYSTDPGNSTLDKIFLLSISEAEHYLDSDKARQAQASEYAKKQGTYTSYSGNTWWWLRSPGFYQNFAAGVLLGGSVDHGGRGADYSSGAVRPALWIDL